MTKNELFRLIQKKKSFLCIGLDSDMEKIPEELKMYDDPVFEFNRQIIDHTHSFAIAYKPNLAFYECRGTAGWQSLEKTIGYLKNFNVLTIADAKRGDIGNTSKMYAKAFFEVLNFDAVTVAPYMGSDSVNPFFGHPGKWVILLALTSNKGAFDFQFSSNINTSRRFFEDVIAVSSQWGSQENMMYVVGATQAAMLKDVRKLIPDHFLLIPGVGAQGGSLREVAANGINRHCGLIVNSSREIIFASAKPDFAKQSQDKARELQNQMEKILIENNLLKNG
ncbi:MAG: orotidine-5'-phosphate decarboxylase [Bacteroidetes bacterium]|nr:orotidine-5'-phosphate decarboxylase [Bacteroidota bacterium]